MQILFTIKQRQTGGKKRKYYLKSKAQLKLGICITLTKDFYTSSDIIFPAMSGRIIKFPDLNSYIRFPDLNSYILTP